MPYCLNNGKGKKVAVYSTCVDLTYAQAEVLLLAEDVKKETPDAFIIAFVDLSASISGSPVSIGVDRFIEPYKQAPKDLKRLEELRATIQKTGFMRFILSEYSTTFDSFMKQQADLRIGRSVGTLVDQLAQFREAGDDTDIAEMTEDLFANPLHAGIHYDFPASVPDELWIADAAKSIRRATPERWLRRLLTVLRFYLRGQPKVPLPHKNDRCPCGSSKRYGRCCGAGVEHEDPESCKLGKHEYSPWQKTGGKFVRSCDRCYRVYDAPWFEETHFEGVQVTIIGCQACGMKPTPEDIHREIGQAITWHTCGACGKAFTLVTMLIEHDFADGKHGDRWMATEMSHKEESADLESKALGKGVFVHKECFMKAFPAWPKVAKPLGEKAASADIVRQISPPKAT